MACDITSGFALDCKDQRIGVKQIDLSPFVAANIYTITAGEIATLPVGLTAVFTYEVKATGNLFTDTPTVNADTRTVEFVQSLTALIHRLTKEKDVQLQLLIYGRVVAFVHDYNGNVWALGIDSGMEVTTLAKSTDTQTYTVTLEAKDNKFAPLLSTAAKTALAALATI